MSTEEEQPKQDKQRGEQWVSGTEWIVCSVIALLVASSNARNNPGGGIAGLLGGFVGSLAVVGLFWVTVRGIYRWITKKKPVA
jgi:hypothetical protein